MILLLLEIICSELMSLLPARSYWPHRPVAPPPSFLASLAIFSSSSSCSVHYAFAASSPNPPGSIPEFGTKDLI